MKTLMISAAVLAMMGQGAVAQTAVTPSPTQTPPAATQPAPAATQTAPAAGATGFLQTPDPSSLESSNFVGMKVYSTGGAAPGSEVNGAPSNWKEIGSIGDLVFSRNGQIQAVVVNVGGFLGIGDHSVALDMNQLKFVANTKTQDPNDFLIAVPQTKDQLKAAPEFKKPNLPQATTGTTTGAVGTAGTGAAAGSLAGNGAGTGMNGAGTGMQTGSAATGAATVNGTGNGAATMSGTTTAQNQTAQNQAPAAQGFSPVQNGTFSAKKLQGAPVYNQQNNVQIGDVSKLILDSQGQLQKAVVDVGGFLGIGSKAVALTPDQMKIMQKDSGKQLRVYVAMSKDELKALPTYKG